MGYARRVTGLLVVVTLAGLCAGCGGASGSATARITGSIAYAGKTVKGGTVVFHAQGGGTYAAAIKPDGTYALVDVPPGEMTVTIDTEALNPANKGKQADQVGRDAEMKEQLSKQKEFMVKSLQGKAPIDTAGPQGEYVPIPAKYRATTSSGLTYTVTAGSQTKNFDLSD